MTCDRQRMNQVAACLRRRGRNPVKRYLDRGDPDLIQIDPDSFTQKLLQTIRRNPLISRKLLAVELNASERKIRESLKNLKDSGFVIRQGPDHGGIWRVSRLVKNCEYVLGKELGKGLGKKTEVGEKTSELVEKTSEVGEKIPELGAKEPVDKSEFEILMGTYRRDFRENAYRVYLALVEDPKTDAMRLSQMLGLSENSVGRAIRAMKDIGLLVREGGDKGGRWIVKRGFKA